MKALVFGSLNIDKVYSLPHLPEKGETLYCKGYELHVGGKGLNQSVSLKKSGSDSYMAGLVGTDGKMLTNFLENAGVNTDNVGTTDGFTGHAVIEVDTDGQNQMILFPGANGEITPEYCDKVLENFDEGDLILMQYEISSVEYLIRLAKKKKMLIAFNPSPYVDEIKSLPLELIDYLILNEFEGQSLADENDCDRAVDKLRKLNENGAVVMTLGGDGVIYADKNEKVRVPAFKVNAVDTTGAGDTFTGYFLTEILSGEKPKVALRKASAASAIVVQKTGAAETIPEKKEVETFLNNI